MSQKKKNTVCSYSLLYRKNSSKYWVSLGEFSGNFDRTSIVSHRFEDEINCRYIRLIPLTFCNSPSIQVGFWNSEELKDEKKDANTVYSLNLKSKRDYQTKVSLWKDPRDYINHGKKRTEDITEMKNLMNNFNSDKN